MAKLAPSDLAQVLSKLPKQENKDIIVGYEHSDDAGVFRLNDETSLVQTLDFFTPIADDAEMYGRIAAVNSLNDVYAMGGTPITALSIVCYPQKGDWDILGKILLGGHKAMSEEGVAILGGHSVDDAEMKFGYSVTGTVATNKVITNAGSKPGDLLVLTKPIGTGVISTAIKFEKTTAEIAEHTLNLMATSARIPSNIMRDMGANGCTDITGFGLIGHAFEMAKASKVTFEIDSAEVPLLPDIIDLIDQKMLTRGDRNNREYVGNTVRFDKEVSGQMQSALFDPQTAGGLLISFDEEKARKFVKLVEGAKIIGGVKIFDRFLIEVG
ncbi:MAG: selenide, water dikinase SelD [Pyrinomonadaceae bacterium]